MNSGDLLGALLKSGLAQSTNQRVDHSLSKGGLDEMLREILGGAPAAPTQTQTQAPPSGAPGGSVQEQGGGALDALTKAAGAIFGESGKKSILTGSLGALLGALLSGGKAAGSGAMKGGILALLGAIALKALRGAGKKSVEEIRQDPSLQLTAGLREPEDEAEQEHVRSLAHATLVAMLNAAKADGQVDKNEMSRIMGELESDGVSSEEQQFVLEQLRKPINIDEVVDGVTSLQAAAQVYAASLLAINLDTPAEREYMQELAKRLNLDPEVVRHLEQTLGVS